MKAGTNKLNAQQLHSGTTRRTRGIPRTDLRYWLEMVQKVSSATGAESPNYSVHLAYRGRRMRFALETPNKDTAARKAQKIFLCLVTNGWEATLAEFKPGSAKPTTSSTIGELFSQVATTAGFRSSTFTAYTQSLRTIAAGIADIGDQPARDAHGEVLRDDKGKPIILSRHDTWGQGRDAWCEKVDALRLDILTPERIQKWKLAYIAKAGTAPDVKRRAENSAVALMRNARSLFSEKALEHARASLCLPDPLPFSGVKLLKKQSARYVSRIDAKALIAAAQDELAAAPERQEQFKLFCLALLCGLRKNEVDTLLWRQVDLSSPDKGTILIEPTEHFTPKSEDSIGAVDLDPELVALLRGWKARAKSEFVIESTKKVRYHTVSRRWYRCEKDFNALYAWLKDKGVSARKPVHELRKELGAILASEQGIFAAQRVLRHAQIATTADYYTDKKSRITGGLGKLLKQDTSVILFNTLKCKTK